MKTYSETKGRKTFNWFDVLKQAAKKQPSDRECDKLKNKANSWVTCACGTQCAIIPRDIEGEPVDFKLNQLGKDFFYAIDYYEWKKAISILKRIEKRSKIVIANAIKQWEKAGFKIKSPK